MSKSALNNSISKLHLESKSEPWIKKYLPKTLFGRAFMIIMLPIALMQLIVAYIFFDAHWQTVTANLSDSVAADIAVAVQLYEQDPHPETAIGLDALLRPNMQLSVAFLRGKKLPTATRRAFFSSLDKTLRGALTDNVAQNFWFDTTRYPNQIDIRIAVDGGVLRFIVPRERVFAPTGFIFIFWMITATLLLSLVSILFILNQARPMVKLAKATSDFGMGRDIGDFKPSGAAEVRQAGGAFLQMRERIGRHIQQRTALLAGVSHDLRTPLTRLKLHLALAEKNADNDAARRDVDDLESMLDGYLDFASGVSEEDVANASLRELILDISIMHEAVSVDIIEPFLIDMRVTAMKRALTNLIENAVNHAENIRITARSEVEMIQVFIDDDGPGISEDKRDEAIKPFIRLDISRNQNRKGVGLGLSIASDVIQAHGGTLQLLESRMGGLRCVINLPR